MSNDKVVRGWAWPSAFEPHNDGHGGIGIGSTQTNPAMVPVAIVPADLWERVERDHMAMEAMRANLAPRFAWIFDGYDLKQGSKDHGYPDPTDAILGEAP